MTVSTVPFIARVVAGYRQDDALAIWVAIDDAAEAGLDPRVLIVALAGTVAGLLADRGFDVEHVSQGLLRSLAAGELKGDCQ